LRLDESCRVPRLYGFKPSSDPEMSSLIKTMLFRPLCPSVSWVGDDEDGILDLLSDLLDGQHSYLAGWTVWFDEQRILADLYREKQARAGKIFTLEDILVSAPSDVCRSDSPQPSAAEFMAQITVTVCTHLDMSADCKKRRGGQSRRDASEYAEDEKRAGEHRSASGCVPDDAVPAGPESVVPEVRLSKDALGQESEPMCPVSQSDVRSVAFYEGLKIRNLQKFVDAFLTSVDTAFRPGRIDPSRPALRDFTGLEYDDYVKRQARASQQDLFDWKNVRASGAPDCQPLDRERRPPGVDVAAPPAEVISSNDLRPRDFAAELVAELAARPKKPVRLGDEQMEFLASVVEHIELVRDERMRDKVPQQRVFCLLGQGGSGKSELIGIVRTIVEKFFGDESFLAMASSNTAARGIRGDTIHSQVSLSAASSLMVERLSVGVTAALKDRWANVAGIVVDEISLVKPMLFAALSCRASLARRETHNAKPDLYTEKGHAFGQVPLVILAGDFMQLTPFEKGFRRVSLLMEPERAGRFDQGGIRLFRQCVTDVFHLTKTFRFRDEVTDEPCPDLPRLLQFMREPKGRDLPAELWEKVQRCQCKGGRDPRLQEERRLAGLISTFLGSRVILWSVLVCKCERANCVCCVCVPMLVFKPMH
jgi:hypothetical protein